MICSPIKLMILKITSGDVITVFMCAGRSCTLFLMIDLCRVCFHPNASTATERFYCKLLIIKPFFVHS